MGSKLRFEGKIWEPDSEISVKTGGGGGAVAGKAVAAEMNSPLWFLISWSFYPR